MVELWKYYKEENWQYVLTNVVPLELKKNNKFYEYILLLMIFPDDISKVLASLFDYMFFKKTENFEKWLNHKHQMLDNYTPVEILKEPNGINTLKEYLLRYPKI